MDEAGFSTAHIAGHSLGGHVALQLAARGRARSVVAFAPAGGWAQDDRSFEALLAEQATMHEQAKAVAPHAEAIVATAEGRRRATRLITTNFEHIPADLLAHQLLGVAELQGRPPDDRVRAAGGLRRHRRAADHLSGADRVGHRRPAPCRGHPPPRAFGRSGSRTPIGSSSTASATAPSSTYRSRPPSSFWASPLRRPRRGASRCPRPPRAGAGPVRRPSAGWRDRRPGRSSRRRPRR